MTIDQILEHASVIPVMTIEDAALAGPLATALREGGLRVVELTLRTDAALDALREMKAAEPSLVVGMGSMRSPEHVESSLAAGADFLVSPGATSELLRTIADTSAPALPGVATASEAMNALQAGFKALKFFPAEMSGGIAWLKAIAGPLPEIRFCPTGAISADKAPQYLALPNVACVGGSWVTPNDLVEKRDWAAIKANAMKASAMKSR